MFAFHTRPAGRVFGLIAVIVLAGTVQAGMMAAGGNVVMSEPPDDIRSHRWESNTEIRGWFERSVTLTKPQVLGHVLPGRVDAPGMNVYGMLPAGAQVFSYMFRADPVGSTKVILSGYAEFSTPILGVSYQIQLNQADDVFGRAGVQYNKNNYRGLELGEDWFEISADRLRIDFHFETGSYTDDLRVITAIPEPSAACLLIAASLVIRLRRMA